MLQTQFGRLYLERESAAGSCKKLVVWTTRLSLRTLSLDYGFTQILFGDSALRDFGGLCFSFEEFRSAVGGFD
jgi:hypothetical protein